MDKILMLSVDPNTITEGRKEKELKADNRDAKFSDTFAWTGATVLVSKKNLSIVDSGGRELENLKLGVTQGTTTKLLVAAMYPSLIRKNISILDTNKEGIDKLKNESINVFFQDDLILNSVLKTLEKDKYSIIPRLISYEQYGIVVYRTSLPKNNQLLTAINDLLKEAESKKVGNTELKGFNNKEFQEFYDSISTKNISNPPNRDSFWDDKLILWAILLLTIILISIVFIKLLSSHNFNVIKRKFALLISTQVNSGQDVGSLINLINIFQPHNHNSQGDIMTDSSRNINVKGNLTATGSAINLGEINGNINNIVEQLQNSQEPETPKLADLISQLQTAINNDSKLTQEQKVDALEALASIGEEAEKQPENRTQKIFKFALNSLKNLASITNISKELANIINDYLPQIATLIGL